MSRIHPTSSQQRTKKNRAKNIMKWIITFAGCPLAYVILPISCCVRNPAAHVLNNEPPSCALDTLGENLAVGCMGISTLVMCAGCCCGCCGNFGPEEF